MELTLHRFLEGADGLHTGVPDAPYHAFDACSNSRLGHLLRSPAHCRTAIDAPAAAFPAQLLGTAVHAAVLEPERFESQYIVAPDVDRRTKAGRAAWAELVERFGEKRILKPDDFEVCLRVRDAIAAHPAARALLATQGLREVSALWQHTPDGAAPLRCKARLDHLSTERGLIVDLKTTRDASPAAFERSLFNFGYHRQAAFYIHGMAALGYPIHDFAFICVEKTPPYGVAVYRIASEAVEAGWQQLQPLIATYAACRATDRWPGYPDEIQSITLPRWAWSQLDEPGDEAV